MPQNEYDGNRQVKKGEIRRMRRVDYAVSPKQRKASNFAESRGQVWIEIKKTVAFLRNRFFFRMCITAYAVIRQITRWEALQALF